MDSYLGLITGTYADKVVPVPIFIISKYASALEAWLGSGSRTLQSRSRIRNKSFRNAESQHWLKRYR